MITGDNSGFFTHDSDVVGSHGGWTAPESIPKDQSTGFESIDAYFDTDDEPEAIFRLSPSLHNIEFADTYSPPYESLKRARSSSPEPQISIKRRNPTKFDKFEDLQQSPLAATSKARALKATTLRATTLEATTLEATPLEATTSKPAPPATAKVLQTASRATSTSTSRSRSTGATNLRRQSSTVEDLATSKPAPQKRTSKPAPLARTSKPTNDAQEDNYGGTYDGRISSEEDREEEASEKEDSEKDRGENREGDREEEDREVDDHGHEDGEVNDYGYEDGEVDNHGYEDGEVETREYEDEEIKGPSPEQESQASFELELESRQTPEPELENEPQHTFPQSSPSRSRKRRSPPTPRSSPRYPSSPEPSSPPPSGRPIIKDKNNEGRQPPSTLDIPVGELERPIYRELIADEPLESDLGDSDSSVASMVVDIRMTDGMGMSDDLYVDEPVDTMDSSDFDSEVEEIDVSNVSPPPSPGEDGLRRSRRSRVPAISTWRGEHIIYEYDPVKKTRTAISVHTVEPDEEPTRKRTPKRRAPITVLKNTSSESTDGQSPSKAPDFDVSIREYQQRIMAKSLNREDGKTDVPFADSPNVMIQTILAGQRNMPVVIAQLTFRRGAAIPPRNAGNLWYTFICWTGKLKFNSGANSLVLQREGSVTIPAGQDFRIENVGLGNARLLMVQAQTQDLAEEYSRLNASKLSNFDDEMSEGPSEDEGSFSE